MAGCLKAMVTPDENTAPGSAMTLSVARAVRTMGDMQDRVMAYRTAMSLAKEMLNRGIICQEEYAVIDTIMAKKYGLSSCTIWRE